MASLVNHQNPITSSSRFQDSVLLENKPKMLKDFLKDDRFHLYSSSSSSSKGFSMYPRKNLQCESKVLPITSKSNKTSMVLLRSQSKKATATTISAIHKVINVVKFFPFASVKCPLALHKRVTRKFSKKSKDIEDISPRTTEKLKVKDILRWKSFRDLVEERSTLVDFPLSPNQCTTITTTTTTTTTSCSRRSSWCDSDFTAEDLPLCCGENEDIWGKQCLLGHHGTDVTLTNPKGGLSIEESDQQSPVSVLESTFRENIEGYFSPFRRILANFSNTIFEEELNEFEEKAKLLLSHVKESCVTDTSENQFNYDLIFDYFIHELSTNEKLHDDDFEREILRTTQSWMNGQILGESYEWEIEDKREFYVKDMEKGVGWKVFKQEEEEISKELEVNVLNELIDEVLDDLLRV